MNKKKILVLILTLVLLVSVFVGCDKDTSGEITYSGAINILCVDSLYSINMLSAIQKKFPDAQLNVTYYAGSNPTAYAETLVKAGEGPDIILTTEQPTEYFQKNYLFDLSRFGFALNYKQSLVKETSIGTASYVVPGSYSYLPIFYNKDLFATKGWTVPKTSSEMISLINSIKTNNITPIAISGADDESFFGLLAALGQTENLTTLNGIEWITEYKVSDKKEYSHSEAGFSEGWDLYKNWISNGAFNINNRYSNEKEVFNELISGTAAMAFVSGNVSTLDKLLSSNDSIGSMAIVGTDYANQVVPYAYNYFLSLNKSVNADSNKLAYCANIMKYLTSEDGINAISNSNADISPIAKSNSSWSVYSEIIETVNAGYTALQLHSGFEQIIPTADDFIKSVAFNGFSASNLYTRLDDAHKNYMKIYKSDSYGFADVVKVASNFTEAQTTQLMADIMLSQNNVDLSLVTIGGLKNGILNASGVNGKLFAGTLTDYDYNTCLPGAGCGTIKIVTLTGAQIVELINKGKTLKSGDNSATFDYYWSGIKVSLNDYNEVTGITFTDGRNFEKTSSANYRVAMVSNDYDSSNFSAYTSILDTNVSLGSMFKSYVNDISNPIETLTIPQSGKKDLLRTQW